MRLMWWLITIVTLGFLWLVIARGRALEMAVALLVLLMEELQLVNVSAIFCYWTFLLPSHSTHSPAITCPGVPTLNNGSINFCGASPDENGNYIFAVMATYNCDTGFSLVGNNSRTCTGNGSSIIGAFDGSASTCQRELHGFKLVEYYKLNHVPSYSLYNSYHLPFLDYFFQWFCDIQ